MAESKQSVYDGTTVFTPEADFHAHCTIGSSLGLELDEAAQVMLSQAIEKG